MTNRARRIRTAVPLLSLAALFLLELLLGYDTLERKLALAVTSGVVLGTVILFQMMFRRHFANETPWIVGWIAAVGVWFDAVGNFAGLYGRFLWWDRIAHAVGAAAVAGIVLVVLHAVEHAGAIRLTRWWRETTALGCAILLSVFYEISEYLGDSFFATHRVTDVFDTSDDLLWGVVAAWGIIWIVEHTWHTPGRIPR